MWIALVLFVALALAGPARGGWSEVALPPVEDVGVPYWCSWGYDWDERCYRDDSERLPIGGVDDKVWRTALRFSLAPIPAHAAVGGAELWFWFDRTCVAQRRRTQQCSGRGFDLEADPVYTERWGTERELAFGPPSAAMELEPSAEVGWRVFDLTELVRAWIDGGVPNNGVLVKLADEDEAYRSSGPAFPSSSYVDPSKRPRLVVAYSG